MGIKATIKDNNSKVLEYPKLMKYTGNNTEPFIVLFNEEGHGMVVQSVDKNRNVGEFCSYWHMNCFEEFNGSVELTNDI